jgi:hypothetical protein
MRNESLIKENFICIVKGVQALGQLDPGYVVRSCGPSSPVRLSPSTVSLVEEQERGVD